MSGDDEARPPFMTALLIARGCPVELLSVARSWLGRRQVPDDPFVMLAQVDEAIAVARSVGTDA